MSSRKARQFIIIAVLAGASFSTQAAESTGPQVAATLGQWIAAQGNAALKEIQGDLLQQFHQNLAPLMPVQEHGSNEGARPRQVDTEVPATPELSV